MKKLKPISQGYIGMEKIKELIRLNEAKIPKKEIAKTINIARGTVIEYVKRVENQNISYSEIKDFSEEQLEQLLGIRKSGAKGKKYSLDFEYIKKELLKPSVTKYLLWQELLEKHSNDFYGYSHFCQQLAQYEQSQKIWMRQVYKAGEQAQIDFAGDRIPIYNKETLQVEFEANIFVSCLPASNLTTAVATVDQTIKSWILGISHMCNCFQGVPNSITSDNAKAVISEANFYEPTVNRVLTDVSQHYNTAIIPTRPNKPKDKSKVENAVGIVQRLLASLRNIKFFSIAELQLEIDRLITDLNNKKMQAYGKSRLELFNEVEKQYLKPLPQFQYKLAQFNSVRVKPNYHVLVDNNHYSVHYSYREQIIETRVYDQIVEVYSKNIKIATHKLISGTNQYSTLKEHMPAQHKFMEDWTPEKFTEKASEIGVCTLTVIQKIFSLKKHPLQAYKVCLGVLNLERKHTAKSLEKACLIAVQHNCYDYKEISKIIVNLDLYPQANEPSIAILHENLRDPSNYY